MNTFTRKGYGRIYVQNSEDCDKVKEIIKELNEFEYEYLPQRLIAHISHFPAVVYTGKFDELDLDLLTIVCAARGINIFCFDSRGDEFATGYKKFEELTAKTP